ncbi:hypothetical protein ACFE04_029691 [Oxalis oulophora]
MEIASRSPASMSYSVHHGNFTVFKPDVKEFPALEDNNEGLMHFQFNSNAQEPTMDASRFGSANAGTVSLQTTLFASDINDTILAITFRIDDATIQALKASFAPKA